MSEAVHQISRACSSHRNIRAAVQIVKGAVVARTKECRRSLRRLLRDEAGAQLITVVLLMPALLGITAIATDGLLWGYAQQNLQAAADAAAGSVAKAYSYNTSADLSLEAKAIAAQYGIVDGVNGNSVVVDTPPQSGTGSCTLAATDPYVTNTTPDYAFEVIITQPQPAIFSTIFGVTSPSLCALAVAHPTGGDCILALNASAAGAFTASNNATVSLSGCGLFSDSNNATDSILVSGTATITATNGGTIGAAGGIEAPAGQVSPTPVPNQSPVSDPYASVTIPTPGNATTFSAFIYSPPSTVSCGTTTPIPSPLNAPFTLTPGGCYTGPGGSNHGLINIGTNGCLVATVAGTYTIKGNGGIQISATPPSGGSCNGKSVNVPSTATLNVSGPIAVSTAGISITLNLPAFNIGGITVSNNGALTLAPHSATAIVNGPINVTSGNLTISPNTNVATIVNVNGGISNSGTLSLNPNLGSGSLSYVMNGGISSSGTSSLGSATYQLTDIISVNAGTFTLNPGTYTLNNSSGSAAAIDVSGTLAINGGTYTLNIGGPLTAENNASINFGSSGNYKLASGLAIAGTHGAITFGSNTTFSANGLTQLKGGTLSISSGAYTFDGGINNSQAGTTINITGSGASPATVILSSTSTTTTTLTLHGSGSLTATNATLVFTSNNNTYPPTMMDIPNGASVSLSAPSTGTTSGMAIMGDRNMPVGTIFQIENGAHMTFTGAIYLPKGALNYAGGAATTTPCSQLVANTFSYAGGTATYANGCAGVGTFLINPTVLLVE